MKRQPGARLVDRGVVWLGFFGGNVKGLMLFNSYQFIFLFLPIALIGYFLMGRLGNLAPVIWLALASLAFYSVSNWQFVLLLLASIIFNYLIGLLLISKRLTPIYESTATIDIDRQMPSAIIGHTSMPR